MSYSAARKAHHASHVPLVRAAEATTTPAGETDPKALKINKKAVRRAQNEEYLKDGNVKAFLGAIAWTEGGGYDFKFGAVAGKKNDKWRFTDYSTHPGPGSDGHTTAAGMYQITKDTWKDHGINSMGLSDFSPHTQELIAVNVLRRLNAIDAIVEGNFKTAMSAASKPWAALAQGPGLPNRYPKQPYKPYEATLQKYKELGGVEK